MTIRLVLCILLVAIAACGAPPPAAAPEPETPPEDLIARVDDRVLTRRDIELLDPTNTLTAEEIGVLVQNWIERELLMKIARERGISDSPPVRLEIEEQTVHIVLSHLGESLEREYGSDSEARIGLEDQLEQARERTRIEAYPWKVR